MTDGMLHPIKIIMTFKESGSVLEGLDPAGLPDESVGFSDTILGITFHGSASVSTINQGPKVQG